MFCIFLYQWLEKVTFSSFQVDDNFVSNILIMNIFSGSLVNDTFSKLK